MRMRPYVLRSCALYTHSGWYRIHSLQESAPYHEQRMDDTCGSVEALQHKRSGKAACATDTMDEWNVGEKSATVRIRRLL